MKRRPEEGQKRRRRIPEAGTLMPKPCGAAAPISGAKALPEPQARGFLKPIMWPSAVCVPRLLKVTALTLVVCAPTAGCAHAQKNTCPHPFQLRPILCSLPAARVKGPLHTGPTAGRCTDALSAHLRPFCVL
ncbi:hypothetical protein NDU88_001063 [Pleurodeles waltl]|uniref:Uncharacterized protein n=1 Tax=Pleurodeles waltl TaxID=8319 RepID=A0AAV7P2U3_PLEWA|nr:hypothetical protein NDU88_001063 [Pleurodeles waltl]